MIFIAVRLKWKMQTFHNLGDVVDVVLAQNNEYSLFYLI